MTAREVEAPHEAERIIVGVILEPRLDTLLDAQLVTVPSIENHSRVSDNRHPQSHA